jgi:two-component system sensor kinase FixL
VTSLASRALLALACVAGAGLIRFVLDDVVGGSYPYLPFIVAVLLAAALGGWRAGIIALVLSQLLAAMFVRISPVDSGRTINALLFGIVSLAIIGVAEKMNALRDEARRNEEEAHRRRKQAERSKEEFSLMIDGARDYAFHLLDTAGYVTSWNSGAERLTGWREDEVLNHHVGMLYPARIGVEAVPERDIEEARTFGNLEREAYRCRRDGSEFLAHVSITALHDADGQVIGFGQILRDITRERADANELHAHAAHLRSILSTVPEGMIVTNERGQIQFFSVAAEEILGVKSDEVIGLNANIFVPRANRAVHARNLRKFVREGRRSGSPRRRIMVRRFDGSTFQAEVSIGQAVSGDQRILTIFIRDMTEHDIIEARLEELRQDLIHATRVSSMGAMASTLAHEINQPLATMLIFVETARAHVPANDPDQSEALDEAICQARRVGEIVRKLREFVARGEVVRTIESLPDLIEDALSIGRIRQMAQAIPIRLALDEDIGPVLVDRVQIQQVVINLLRNAIEALAGCEHCELRISARRARGQVQVTIADNGPGVSANIAKKLFAAFNSSKGDGMGLGLSICRTIVEANGGRIWYEAHPDGGSRFHFTLLRANAFPVGDAIH